MADTTFRKPVEKPKKEEIGEEKVRPSLPKSVPVEEGETDVPVSLHKEIKGIPYSAVYFEIKEIWDDPDLGYKEDIEEIEAWYKEKVQSGEIEDRKESFEEFIKQAEKVTNTKNSPIAVKTAKIAEWVRFMRRMDEIDKNRRRYANY